MTATRPEPFDPSDEQSGQRTSLYLIRRADALLAALRFFAASAGGDTTRRRLQFLTQSDFWEWELDNLIYSFTNLAERQRTWRSPRATAEKLGRLGIAVDAKLLRHAVWRPGRPGRWQWSVEHESRRVAPVELLRETIDLWNQVIDLVEAQFIVPMRRKAELWNVQTRTDLRHLRKAMPDLESSD